MMHVAAPFVTVPDWNAWQWLFYVFVVIPFCCLIVWCWSRVGPGRANPGQKVKRYKIVSGRRVRDYDAERQLKIDTTPERRRR